MKSFELKIPPVAVVLAVAFLMWIGTFLLPQLTFQFSLSLFIAISLAIIGLIITSAGVSSFNRNQTTTNPLEPNEASSLVVSGIYRFSRNPMYLGFAIALLGWGFYLSNWAAVIFPLLFVGYMNRYQIQPEERILEEKFGGRFKYYKDEVSRWL